MPRLCKIGSGKDAQRRLRPQRAGRLLAVADVQPEKETAGWPNKAESASEKLFREVEFRAVERPVRFRVRVFLPQQRRGAQDRQRDGCAGEGAQPPERLDRACIAGDKAGSQARHVRALRERMKNEDIVEASSEQRAGFERSRRRCVIVDVGLALVDADNEVVGAGESDRRLQRLQAGDRPLRVGGRA